MYMFYLLQISRKKTTNFFPCFWSGIFQRLRNLLFEGKKLWAFFPPSELGQAAPPKVEVTIGRLSEGFDLPRGLL